MDFKEAKAQLQSLCFDEDAKTIQFLQSRLHAQVAVLDVSNKFLFDAAMSELIARLQEHYTTHNSLRKLSLQNTMLETPKLNSLLCSLLSHSHQLSLTYLDIGNNRIDLTAESAELLGKLMSRRTNRQRKTLILQGNLLRSGKVLATLFAHIGALEELNLYDTRLSVDALAAISEALAMGVKIRKLDLGYNADGFTCKSVLSALGMGVAMNSHLEELNICGNSPLGKRKLLTAFCSGMQCSKNLEVLGLGGLQLQNAGIDLLSRFFLRSIPICVLDLHNNSITSSGLVRLFSSLSVYTTALDISYNNIRDERALIAIAEHLVRTRSLRKLNISQTIEIEEISYKTKQRLADAIKKNDSLTEFYCEGAKIGEDPDDFCEVIGTAINDRRLSLTFKISAVNCFRGETEETPEESDYSSTSPPKSADILPSLPPSVPRVNSTQHTERRGFEAEEREISLSETPREYRFTSGSHLDLSLQ